MYKVLHPYLLAFKKELQVWEDSATPLYILDYVNHSDMLAVLQ